MSTGLLSAWASLQQEAEEGVSAYKYAAAWREFSAVCSSLAQGGTLDHELVQASIWLPSEDFRSLQCKSVRAIQEVTLPPSEQRVLFVVPILGRSALAEFLLQDSPRRALADVLDESGFVEPGQGVEFLGSLSLARATALSPQQLWGVLDTGQLGEDEPSDDPLAITVLVGVRRGSCVPGGDDPLVCLTDDRMEAWETRIASRLAEMGAPQGVVSVPQVWEQGVIHALSWALDSYFLAWCMLGPDDEVRGVDEVASVKFEWTEEGVRAEGFSSDAKSCGAQVVPGLDRFWGYRLLLQYIQESGADVEEDRPETEAGRPPKSGARFH